MRTGRITRRQFLKGTGAAAGVALFSPSLAACCCRVHKPCPIEPVSPFVRRDIGGLSETHPVIVSYRKAIHAMQALPTSDPRSWAYQAAIHGTLTTPALTAWNTCEHGSYFFWSWHRMYLYWFERIVREMSGDHCWALPFWNWTSPSERQLPAMFRDPASELFTPNRDPNMNSGAGSLPAFDVDYSSAFTLTDFVSASGSLEITPHAAVHIDMGGWMGSVPTAAQDPIFYLHHCNIDRLWNLWLAQGGGRTDPLTDATWKSTTFTFFDENGQQVTMTSCDVLRAAKQLDYTYEGEPPQVEESCVALAAVPLVFEREVIIRLPIPPVVLSAERVSFNADVGVVRGRLTAALENKMDTVFLELEEVEADQPPGVVWEVYFGLPDDAAPDPTGPYYVGNVALFGAGIRSEPHHFTPARFAFPIGTALARSLGENPRRIPVTFVAHGVVVDGRLTRPKPASPVRIGRISLTVQHEKSPQSQRP